MGMNLLQLTDPSLAYTVIGGFIVVFSMVSFVLKDKFHINEVVLGTAFGILMGPYCANAFNPRSWGTQTNVITLEVMRVILGVGLFAIGVELPPKYLYMHAKGLLIMVVPTMAFGWLIIAGIIKVLFPTYNFISALVVAACLTPTDPIVCAAIVGKKFKGVSTELRRILTAESAANDGLAYPFLSIAIYLTVEESRKVAIGKWFLVGWLYQVILGVVLGACLAYACRFSIRYSDREDPVNSELHRDTDREDSVDSEPHKGSDKGLPIDSNPYNTQFIALALFTIGVTSTIGSDDLLAAFAAGSAISWDDHFHAQVEKTGFSAVIDFTMNCGCFIYIGAWLPFDEFHSPVLGIEVWRLIVLFIAVLFLRRIPPLLLLYKWVDEINGWKQALCGGHFGPMGVSAVFISTLALARLPKPHSPPETQEEYLAATLQTIVSFIVLDSILVHGLSIPLFSLGRGIPSNSSARSYSQSSSPNSPEPSVPLETIGNAHHTRSTVRGDDLEGGTPE